MTTSSTLLKNGLTLVTIENVRYFELSTVSKICEQKSPLTIEKYILSTTRTAQLPFYETMIGAVKLVSEYHLDILEVKYGEPITRLKHLLTESVSQSTSLATSPQTNYSYAEDRLERIVDRALSIVEKAEDRSAQILSQNAQILSQNQKLISILEEKFLSRNIVSTEDDYEASVQRELAEFKKDFPHMDEKELERNVREFLKAAHEK